MIVAMQLLQAMQAGWLVFQWYVVVDMCMGLSEVCVLLGVCVWAWSMDAHFR